MEYLIISENKLKIMLSAEEVGAYAIESEVADYKDPEVRRAFWRILDRARDECGFKVTGEKLLIQYYPSKSGAEIFVTKLGKISTGVERSLCGSDSIAMLASKNMIYRFDSVDSLNRLCKEILRTSEEVRGDVYFSEDGCYYLFFEERGDYFSLSPFSVISEFGEEIPQNISSYIKEHSKPIAIGDGFRRFALGV
jgi:negative regulator of genetic competence, sporulation and motility